MYIKMLAELAAVRAQTLPHAVSIYKQEKPRILRPQDDNHVHASDVIY